jgi:hypothetical protein
MIIAGVIVRDDTTLAAPFEKFTCFILLRDRASDALTICFEQWR